LDKKLQSELPGILAWAMEGCLEYQKTGLQLPNTVLNAVNQYRSEADPVEKFILDCCFRPKSKFVKKLYTISAELFAEWKNWCGKNGIDVGSHDAFSKILVSKGYETGRKRSGETQHRIFKGIKLKSEVSKDILEAHEIAIETMNEFEDSDT